MSEPGWVENGRRRDLPLPTLLGQGFDFVHELIDVLELSIHGGESHIGDLVELRQLLHDFFADDRAVDLPFRPFPECVFRYGR